MSKGKVLVIGSNATRIEVQGGRTGATGQYLNETVVPAMALVEAGYDVVLATPNGAKPHIDEASDSAQHFGGDEAAYQRARAFFADDPSMNQGRTLRSVIGEGLKITRAYSFLAAKRQWLISCRIPRSARSCGTSTPI